ncbi:uncharacterized protein LOC116412637 isoform X2 [Galleria mellonella]|uniref:Uncharacterized protein LOC116412637 isoform X2 n=1 Tax=Galleria mellonella TaxID=7137 RepID=A0A6J3BVR8_GALME|nr:uncharacterized protein LOC116412637 isoform X2 [Galleria mellonella]
MTEEVISKCYFIPRSTMNKVCDILDNPLEREYFLCRRNLLKMQSNIISQRRHRMQMPSNDMFHFAIHRAIYSHNWNKLLYLLKKYPIWHHYRPAIGTMQDTINNYLRAMVILLMYHPTAKAKSLLEDYFHKACTCRTEVEKKAFMRVLLTLPEKFLFKIDPQTKRWINEDDYTAKEY